MTPQEWRTAPFCGRTAYRASFGENYFAEPINAAAFAAESGDGYRVVEASNDEQPPDHETRYFIRKPNGMLIADFDEANVFFRDAQFYHRLAWRGGFLCRDYPDEMARSKPGFAVVPREVLK
jgi:hypothetical protein